MPEQDILYELGVQKQRTESLERRLEASEKRFEKRLAAYEKRQADFEKKLDRRLMNIENGVTRLDGYAAQWKGGLFVVLGLGSLATWVLSQWEKIQKIIGS